MNASTEKYDRCAGDNEDSLFKLNAEETMLVHTTEAIQSPYFIRSKTYDDQNKVWLLNVESDIGNPYVYVLDFDHKEVRVLVKNGEEIVLVRYYIRQTW